MSHRYFASRGDEARKGTHSPMHSPSPSTMGREQTLFNASFERLEASTRPSDAEVWSNTSSLHSSKSGPARQTVPSSEPTATTSQLHPFGFSSDPFDSTLHVAKPIVTKASSNQPVLDVHVCEQLSMAFDSAETTPKSLVQGSVYITRPSPDRVATPFCLILRDIQDQIEALSPHRNVQDISQQVIQGPGRNAGFRPSDRIFKISLDQPQQEGTERENDDEILVTHYSCSSELRPVPLLVKSRVHQNNKTGSCQVAFKLRANPSNKKPLTQVVVMVAIPPNFSGESAKLSRSDGVWDEMKRTISWCIDSIEPGQAVELSMQIERTDGLLQHADTDSPFPMLVRAEKMNHSFSQVQIMPEFCDSTGKACKVKVLYKSHIVYRKL